MACVLGAHASSVLPCVDRHSRQEACAPRSHPHENHYRARIVPPTSTYWHGRYSRLPHTPTDPSSYPEANWQPTGDQATEVTDSVCPVSTLICVPVSASQTLIVDSR